MASAMHRRQLVFLEHWFQSSHRKPLIIRGARQVGKSTLVRLFAEQRGLKLAEVNLERRASLDAIFASNDPQQIINQLEALPDMPTIDKDSMLFLDEIQSAPKAIPALRYFYEHMAELPVVSASSLLEFILSEHRFSMPVGRIQYLHLDPLTFTEFLEALGERKLKREIDSYEHGKELGPLIHQRLLELLRIYYFVGGMPEAVAVYAQQRKFSAVSAVHSSIIETYRDDFQKYGAARNLARMQDVLNFAARNVGRKIKYSNVSSNEQSATIKRDIQLLAMARVISRVVHSNASGLPLQGDVDEKAYKLLFLDVGLMNAMCGLNWNTISGMNDTRLINEGAIAEQFVGQHLLELLAGNVNRDLTYWLREARTANAEIDYVVSFHGRILPVEVKAGSRGSLRSLHQFAGEKSAPLAVRFDCNLPAMQTVDTTYRNASVATPVRYRLLSLPLYLVERLPDLVVQTAEE
jgi:predicted AAA+ superfamily ATPase